jgi:xanthine dehydrogenase accessory factor
MREILAELVARWRGGESVGIGTVIATLRSAPRPAGASMMVDANGVAVGSVSGGCVEGAVYDLAQSVLRTGRPVRQRYGVSDDDAFAVGLTCGGILDIFVEKVDKQTFPGLGEVAADVEAGRPVAIATVVEHPNAAWVGRRLVIRPEPAGPPRVDGTLGSGRADDAVRDDALGLLASGTSAALGYGPDGERRGTGMRVFVSAFAPKPRLLVFGAIDFAAAVARVGAFLGYHVTVCDARPVFATRARFPDADDVVVDWPHRYLAGEQQAGRIDARTVVAVLTHDPKFDVPLLEVALRMPELAYVGAMGSRRTHQQRMKRLRDNGITAEQLDRLSSPIGLDLGARTPEETAISIAAELIASRWGGSGRRLAHTAGSIHQTSSAAVTSDAWPRSSASR